MALSVLDCIEKLASGKISSVELILGCLTQCKEQNPAINAFVELYEQEALFLARQSDERRRINQPLSALDGIPFAIKDNFCYRDHLCECGGAMAEGFRPPYSASAVEKLLQAGMIPLGRTNMDEFGMGSRCEHSKFGATHNPLNEELTAGGSSGGSAAAVAAELVPCALGSDTGGSVRVPAAYCGICGVKPAYGSISRWGLVAYASSLDTVGIFTASPKDCVPLLEILTTQDLRDSTQNADLWNVPAITPQSCLMWEINCEEPVKAALHETEKRLSDLGLAPIRQQVPDLHTALAAYYVLSAAEASSNLARFDGLRFGHRAEEGSYVASRGEGFGAETKRRLMMGVHALTEDGLVSRAQQFRKKLCLEMEEMLPDGCILVSPASPTLPPSLYVHREDPAAVYAGDLLTVSASLCGLPSVCIPVKASENAFPVGICLTGNVKSLRILLNLAQQLSDDA